MIFKIIVVLMFVFSLNYTCFALVDEREKTPDEIKLLKEVKTNVKIEVGALAYLNQYVGENKSIMITFMCDKAKKSVHSRTVKCTPVEVKKLELKQ